MKYKHTPEEARALLVAALRSGEYEQHTGQLRSNSGYCCLGVGCDVFLKVEGIGRWREENGTGNWVFKIEKPGAYSTESLPAEVRGWLGFLGAAGEFREAGEVGLSKVVEKDSHYGDKGEVFYNLADANDNGILFPEIADVIEKGHCTSFEEDA